MAKIKIKKRKVEPKRHTIRIKKIKNKTIKIYCHDIFCKTYLKENETPVDYITKIKFKVFHYAFIMENNLEDYGPDQLLKLLNDYVGIETVNNVVGIALGHSTGKLKSLGIMPDLVKVMKKLYTITHHLEILNGIKVLTEDVTPAKIKLWVNTHGFAYTDYVPMKKYCRAFIMNYNNNTMTPIDDKSLDVKTILSNGNPNISLMIEMGSNRFINIPHGYIRKLNKIESVVINTSCIIDGDFDYVYREHGEAPYKSNRDLIDELLEGEEIVPFLCSSYSSDNLQELCLNVNRFIYLWDALDEIASQTGECYIQHNEHAIITFKNGKAIKIDIENFMCDYFGFLS